MRTFFLYFILARILGNPLIAILVIALIYLAIDRRFIGLMPDLTRPLRRGAKLSALRRALGVNPADASAHLELGTLLAEKGRVESALPHLETAAKRLDNSQAHFQLGLAYCKVGREEEGKGHLERALALNPKVGYGEPYLYLAAYELKRTGSVDDLAGLEEALSRYGSTEVTYRLGRLFEAAGQHAKAKEMYQAALEAYHSSPRFLRKKHRREAAAAWLRSRFKP